MKQILQYNPLQPALKMKSLKSTMKLERFQGDRYIITHRTAEWSQKHNKHCLNAALVYRLRKMCQIAITRNGQNQATYQLEGNNVSTWIRVHNNWVNLHFVTSTVLYQTEVADSNMSHVKLEWITFISSILWVLKSNK